MRQVIVDPTAVRATDLSAAADWLRRDGIVLFPTDTFYGFAVDPSSSLAVQQVFDLKGRDARSALPLIAASTESVEQFCGPLNARAARLATCFWPGPLSLILDAPSQVAEDVHAGHCSIAIRVPAHPIARALCEAFGGPLTATSANRSGEPPARTPQAVGALAGDARVLTIDGGPSPGGAPSSIVDARGSEIMLVRQGAIAWERVLESLNE